MTWDPEKTNQLTYGMLQSMTIKIQLTLVTCTSFNKDLNKERKNSEKLLK